MSMSSFILSIISIVGSITTALITILTYNRNRKLENENTIFKLKVEGYTVIMDQLISLIYKVNQTKLHIDDESNERFEKYSVEAIYKDADDIDDKTEKLFITAAKYSMIFPEAVLIEIEQVHEFLYDETIQTKDEPSLTLYSLKITEHYEQLLDIANKVQRFMRTDLHTEKLNQSLFRRLK